MPLIDNLVRRRLEAGEPALGVAVRMVRSVEIAPAMRAAGFDFLFLDLEHGSMPLDTVGQIAITAVAAGISTLVRVPEGDHALATRALDAGAGGIVLPHIESAAAAREAVDRLKFPPLGHRSLGPAPQLAFRPLSPADTMAELNRSGLTVALLETPEAVAQAEAIAAVPGIDVLTIGTNDLCVAMGIPGQFEDPAVVAAYDAVVGACRRHGKWAGVGGVYEARIIRRLAALGCQLLLAGAEMGFMMQAAAARVKELRSPG